MLHSESSTTKRSNDHAKSVRRLVSLFEVGQSVRPILLLGAGASYRAGVPLAEEAVKRILREVCARDEFGTSDIARVKVGDWMRFLTQQEWYRPGPQLAEFFPQAVEHLLRPREYRREFFMREFRAHNGLSTGYRALANMAQRGLWRIALTTNFDTCIADALSEKTPHIHRALEINKTKGDGVTFNVFGRDPQIVYLHGAVESYTDKSTEDEIAALEESLAKMLAPVLRSSPLVVMGYRGAEPSIMKGLLGRLLKETANFKSGIYWCDRGEHDPHPQVLELERTLGRNFFRLPIDGFDEALQDIDEALATHDIYVARVDQILAGTSVARAEDRPLPNSTLADLDLDLALTTLVTYCANVGRPVVTRETMTGLLIEQGLVSPHGESLVPTLAGFLLFGRGVEARCPQAAIELTFGGKRRQLLKGNLITQFSEIVRVLLDKDVNTELRVKTEKGSQKKLAYHPRSITEMVVNLLVHRDYDAQELSRIDVRDGWGISFTNPGGLLASVASQVRPQPDGGFRPVRSVTGLRNPSLADVFYGVGSMDKRGSGLCDAIELMQEHGGSARFLTEDGNSRFVAELLQARQGDPVTSETALSLQPYGQYITNHMRFQVVPEKLTVVALSPGVKMRTPVGTDLLGEPPRDFPVVIQQRERIVSFGTASRFLAAPVAASIVDTEFFRTQRGGHGTLAWLFREHFVRYLRKFQSDGLTIELGGHRAYFVKVGDETPKIRYNTAKRQGIEREVVKRRESRREVWHENEGIAFEVVRFDGAWALQIRPFYMFTGIDGVTPLPSFKRTRLSTSRMRFDRNQAVGSDLGFWARYLSGGSASVQLSPNEEYDLIVEGAFMELELREPTEQGLP